MTFQLIIHYLMRLFYLWMKRNEVYIKSQSCEDTLKKAVFFIYLWGACNKYKVGITLFCRKNVNTFQSRSKHSMDS